MACKNCKFKLSILICSITKRENDFLQKLLANIDGQKDSQGNKLFKTPCKEKIEDKGKFKLITRHYKDVEVLICIDAGYKRGGMSVGEKRNYLKLISKGDHETFVDDDDMLDDYYCYCLLEGIKKGYDVINFLVMFNSANKQKLVEYSLKLRDYETKDRFYRASNHLMCIKKSVSSKLKFKNVNFGEDADYAVRLKKFAKTEGIIGRVLYYYNFSHQTSETQ